MDKKARIISNLIYPLIVMGLVLVIWSVAAKKADSQFILPTLKQTAQGIRQVLGQKAFYSAFFATLKRTIVSFIFAFSAALAFAVLSELSIIFKKLFSPFLSIARALPTMSVILLLLLWTSRDIVPSVIAVLVLLPVLYTQISGGFNSLDKKVFEMAKVYKVPAFKMLNKYVLPQMLPVLTAAAGAGLSFNLKLMVSAEVLAQTANSMGYLMNMSKLYFETAELFALTILTVVTALIIELLFSFLKPMWRWKNA